MKTKMEDFEVLVPNMEGTEVEKKVTVQIPLAWDEEFGQWVLTPEAHQIIDDTKAVHMGLLLPAQLKELRQRLGFSQKQMGELFQVGEKSWTRWESGKHRATRSINLLIRALYDGEISVNYLLERAGKPQQAETKVESNLWVALLSSVAQQATPNLGWPGQRDTGASVMKGIQPQSRKMAAQVKLSDCHYQTGAYLWTLVENRAQLTEVS